MTVIAEKKWAKVDKAFTFFCEHFDRKEKFDLDCLVEATGWSHSTIKTYLRKKWTTLLEATDDGFSVTDSIKTFNKASFRQHQSQKEGVEKTLSQIMVDKSISACVSAIEIYNKPNFEHREESFSILMTNAWELLLKAKMVLDSNNDPSAIYMLRGGEPQITPSGNKKTIPLGTAVNKLFNSGALPSVVADNIKLLMNIRDDSIHFVCGDPELSLSIQSIGTASLKNYMTIAIQWFNYDFSQFNFYLMPVSFFHLSDMTSFSVSSDEKENLVNYLKETEKNHENSDDAEYAISLKLHTKLVKTTSDEAIQVRVTNDPEAPEIIFSEEDALRSYPHTYADLLEIFKKRYSNFKQNQVFNEKMRSIKSEGEAYCKVRRLEPENPKSLSKRFYHSRIIEKFDTWYEKK